MRPGIIMLCCILLSFTLSAQQAPIAIVSTNGATKLVNTLDEAALQAQTDDIIYLPAGSFAGTTFSKKVTVIGVGHHPDSASADGRTFIDGSIIFASGAEASILDGVYLNENVYLIPSCKIYRTNAQYMVVNCGGPNGTAVQIESCIVRNGLYGGNGAYQFCGVTLLENSTFTNSIINGNFSQYHRNNTFENCIILTNGDYDLSGGINCTFKNCIFPNITSWGTTPINSFFYNNIFSASELPPLTNAGNASRNILGQTPAATFVQQSGTVYQYDQNYRLKAGSPGINAGTDGKDIGIYGGQKPYDDYAIPPNPSIRTRVIDSETTPAGTLKVTFKVKVN